VACVRLAPGGLIGRHEAVRRQLLAVVVGDAVVSGADGVEQQLSAGQAAVWEAAEMHQTRSLNGLTAIVIEGDIATTA
jgi:quercetin dioxygenase-like cupin family protein